MGGHKTKADMLQIAAFDLGTNVAIAHNGYNWITCEHTVLEGDRPARQMQFLRYLLNRFEQYRLLGIKFDAVVYERPFARGFHATRSLWGAAGIVEAVAMHFGWPVLDVTPAEIKKFAAQYGGANKTDMTAAASSMGYGGANEHEADAYCLLKYSLKYVVKPEEKNVKRKAH